MSESDALGRGVRFWRQRRGYSQEDLADRAGVSVAVVRKLEQECHGGDGSPGVRLASLYALARALDIETAWLFPAAAPEPADQDPGHLMLMPVRIALTPPVPAAGGTGGIPDGPDLAGLRRQVVACTQMYDRDRYDEVASRLPALISGARTALAASSEEEPGSDAVRVPAAAFQLTGWFLGQVGAGDLAYQAVRDVLASEAVRRDPVTAAACAACECWLFIRQGRLLDAKRTAVAAADAVEPHPMRGASRARLAAWGWLLLLAHAAAARNNQEDEAREFLRVAGTAGAATAGDSIAWDWYWTTLGPPAVAAGAVERAVLAGDHERAVALARKVPAGPARADCRQRHLLDLTVAHAGAGNRSEALAILTRLRETAPQWLRHQRAGRSAAGSLLRSPARVLPENARALADFYDIRPDPPASIALRGTRPGRGGKVPSSASRRAL